MRLFSIVVSVFLFCSIVYSAPALDTFGIAMFYTSKPGTEQWNSAHWNNGIPRTVKYCDDEDDPTGWTEDHSGGTDGFAIDGEGTMTMSGIGPRFHINSLDSSKQHRQFFRNIEFTAYFMHKGLNGQNWGGMVVGLRSGPLGHASSGGNDCDATTYYARFRNDGKWDFEKELKHPGSTYRSSAGPNTQPPLWNGAQLPQNRWIGMKYCIYNNESDSRVTLELYIDSVSHGNPVDGGTWQHVGTVVDSGDWPSGDVSGCTYDQNSIILDGHGTALMRTDGDTAVYAMVSLREIIPESSTTSTGRHDGFTGSGKPASRYSPLCSVRFDDSRSLNISQLENGCFTIRGEHIPPCNVTNIRFRSSGVYITRPNTGH